MRRDTPLFQKWMKSTQLVDSSSHSTIGPRRKAVLFVGVFFLIHLILAAFLPPFEDELYYHAWAKHLAGGYFDHPPMVALLIRFSTSIFGHSTFGIRFFAVLFSSLILWLLCLQTRTLTLYLLVSLTPLFFWGSILMTPDVPFFLFWLLYFLVFTVFLRKLFLWKQNPIDRVYQKSPILLIEWVGLGILLGLGGLSKYSMVFAVPCCFLALAFSISIRAWWKGFLLHLAVAFFVVLPVFLFNVNHHFQSFQFQYENALIGSGTFLAKHFFEFVGSQIALMSALPWLMLPWLVLRYRTIREHPTLLSAFYFFWPPLLFFVINSFRQKLEANWGIFCFLSFWPLAQTFFEWSSHARTKRIVLFLSFLLPLSVTFLVLVHLNFPLKQFPVGRDRIHRMGAVYHSFQTAASDFKQEYVGRTLYGFTYQNVAYLKYFEVPSEQVFPSGKDSQFTLDRKPTCHEQQIYYIYEGNQSALENDYLKCFKHEKLIRRYPIVVRGQPITELSLVVLSK